MAVQKNKKSSSRTKMRRNRARIKKPTLSMENGGQSELRRRHHLGKDGYYRGVRYFEPKSDVVEEEEE